MPSAINPDDFKHKKGHCWFYHGIRTDSRKGLSKEEKEEIKKVQVFCQKVKHGNSIFCKEHDEIYGETIKNYKEVKERIWIPCNKCYHVLVNREVTRRCDKCKKVTSDSQEKQKENRKICGFPMKNGKPCNYLAEEGKERCKNHEGKLEPSDDLDKCPCGDYFEKGTINRINEQTGGIILRCDKCENSYKKEKEKQQEKRTSNKITCIEEGCKNRQYIKNDELVCGGYCYHHKGLFKPKGDNICTRGGCYNEKCRSSKRYCEDCLQNERDNDKKKRNEKINRETKEGYKVCKKCFDEKKEKTFINEKGKMTDWCKECRDENKEFEKTRNRDRSEYYNRIEVLKKDYFKRTVRKNIPYDLSNEQFEELINNKCYYCGSIDENKYNGIDRKDSSLGYTFDNCLTCCGVCNLQKGINLPDIYIKQCIHICSIKEYVDAPLHHNCFLDTVGDSIRYACYRTCAKKRGIEFTLTKEKFDEIIKEECYLCGKENSDIHKNGIDRFVSVFKCKNCEGKINKNCENCEKAPYSDDNVASCCATCNYLKREWSYDFVMDHFLKVCDNWIKRLDELEDSEKDENFDINKFKVNTKY